MLWLIVLLYVIYLVGGLAYYYLPTRALIISLTPINLLFCLVLLLLAHGTIARKQILVFGLIALLGFFVELIGVATGVVFGSYTYGPVLGLKLFDTPIMIGINWIMLIYAIYSMFPDWQRNWLFPFFGASLMVIYDLLLEYFAIKIGLWSWAQDVIPIKNYIAWYIISVVLFFIMQLSKQRISNPLSKYVLLAQLLFFIVVLLGA